MAMRPYHLLLVAIPSMALGFLLGALLSSGSAVKEVAAATPTFAAQSLSAHPAALPTSPPDLVNAVSFEPRVSVLSAGPEGELPEAPAAEIDDETSEMSTVHGSIATLEGVPVAGVELALEPPKDAPKYRVRHAISDATGAFAFSGLPPGVWRVTGRHREYVLQRRNSFPHLVPTGTLVEFVACPAVPVEVRVTGEGANRARVAFRRAGSGEPEWSPWTSSNTVLALSPGPWEFCASFEALDDWPSDRGWKLAPLASPVTTVHVGGADSSVVTLALEKVRCLYGNVQLPAGHQYDQANQSSPVVRLIEARTGTPADFEGEGDRLSRSVEIDPDGRYGFFALPFENWTAGVALDAWALPLAVELVDVEGLTRLDIEDNSEADDSVLIDAFTTGGVRITAGISFSFMHRDFDDETDDYLWQGSRTVLEQDGAMRVIAAPIHKNYREKAANKDELVLRATLPGFTRIEQPLLGLTGERLRLSFVPGAYLEVVLVGDGAERSMQKGYAELKNQEYEVQAQYDENSRALKFDSLSPGAYTLTVRVWGSNEAGDWQMVQLHNGEVVVSAGPQRIELQMPTRAALVVRCPGVKKDARANLTGPLLDPMADREDNWWGPQVNAKVDGSGQVRFENIVAGRYSLTIGQRTQLVSVPCPPFDFEGRIPERYRFRLAKSDSPLRRAGLRSGDVCVTVDEKALPVEETQKRLRALSSQSVGTLRLTVERAGQTLDIVLDAAALGQDESFDGASLEPVLD